MSIGRRREAGSFESRSLHPLTRCLRRPTDQAKPAQRRRRASPETSLETRRALEMRRAATVFTRASGLRPNLHTGQIAQAASTPTLSRERTWKSSDERSVGRGRQRSKRSTDQCQWSATRKIQGQPPMTRVSRASRLRTCSQPRRQSLQPELTRKAL